jgi:ribonuclease HI
MLYAEPRETFMNPIPSKRTTDSTGTVWIRMRFKKNKVWVEADAAGCPLQRDGRVRIKYQLDQPHEYRVKRPDVHALDATPEAVAPPPRHRPAEGAQSQTDPTGKRIVHIYTDGASSGNPGPAGIGVVLQCGSQRREISEYIGEATNNIAELLAIQKGLAAVKNRRLPVRVYTDSSYAFGVLSLDWKPKKNTEIIRTIRSFMATFDDVKLVKVRGHHGVLDNERADALATSAIRPASE